MSQIQVYKNNILLRIEDFKALNLAKIYTDTGVNYQLWNSMDNSDVEAYIKRTLHLLLALEKTVSNFDSGVQIGFLQNIDSYILNSINAYNNSGIRNINSSDITSQHHDFLNNIQNIFNTLWSSPYFNILMNYDNFKQIPIDIAKETLDAQVQLGKFLESKTDISNAIDSARSWLENRNKMEEEVIKKQAGEYESRATEHKTHDNTKQFWSLSTGFSGSWWWLFAAFIFSIITATVTYSFYDSANNNINISVGNAILHIATVIVPAYLTVFSSTQFLYHKKMYESYKFKYASLLTMNYLLELNKGDPIKTEKILNKGLDVLFSEPSVKEDSGKIDKTIVTELIKLATSGARAG